MEEPSVLDYVISRLMFWRGKQRIINIPAPESLDETINISENSVEGIQRQDNAGQDRNSSFAWRPIGAIIAAIFAQSLLEPSQRLLWAAVVVYIIAGGLVIWSILKNEWSAGQIPADTLLSPGGNNLNLRIILMVIPLLAITFLAFSGNTFSIFNLVLWFVLIALCVRLFWIPRTTTDGMTWFKNIVETVKNGVDIKITPWKLIVLISVGLVVFFRFYHLNLTPGEMFSDHAEKLLDVGDVLKGQTSIFFPRNTGREAIQMYLTALIATVFGTGLSFMSLKIGTALAGFCTLPYIYFLGKRVANRWVGLIAFVLAGMSYWHNVISRVGLRFPLYPLFAAPVLFYLIRGLQRSNRNDFILSGIALGIGLHGYSPMRIMPFVIVFVVGLYLLHPAAQGKRKSIIYSLIILAFFAFILFLPLLRYWMEYPDIFGYRAFTRLSTSERAFPAPVWIIFLGNLWNALVMFFWKNGDIWVHSIPGRPALDVVSAALLFCGILFLVVRYIRKRNWLDITLLLLIPLLMLPSILSLAFPDENPSLNRTGAAIIPVFIISAIALEGILSTFMRKTGSLSGKIVGIPFGILLIIISSMQNYSLVFNEYSRQFLAGAWNTSEIGHVIRGFVDSIGNEDTAYVVPYPYWVDTRLVGINAGFPEKDYALWPENFADTLSENGAKLFILKSEDTQDAQKLMELYPSGNLTLHPVELEGKDFYEFYVPPQNKH